MILHKPRDVSAADAAPAILTGHRTIVLRTASSDLLPRQIRKPACTLRARRFPPLPGAYAVS